MHEELLLLALRGHHGTLVTDNVEYVTAGAILAELLLAGNIAVSDGKKKDIDVCDTGSPGNEVLEEALQCMEETKRSASLEEWVARLAEIPDLKHKVAMGLCERGILRAQEDKVFFIFTRQVYPEVNPEPEAAILDRLYGAIFEREGKEDERTVILLSLARQAELLKITFGKEQVKRKEDRIKELTEGEMAGTATGEAIGALQAALVAATCIPVVVTT